jgi:hypothetical protein
MTLCRPLCPAIAMKVTQPGTGAHPATYSVSTGVIYSAEGKEWSHTSTHPICLHNMDSDTFTIVTSYVKYTHCELKTD